ncbi:MAG: hypothetical protein OYH76_10215 [Defluviicoccus sp.]|nr:hypothetical protein [Defluviicoccus sp.]MDE0276259.1 hypothetical protein [Defluviicoccus sp.]
MHQFEHDADDGHDVPSSGDLLAEAGLSVRAIGEVLRDRGGAE